jgi:hypothetical protein
LQPLKIKIKKRCIIVTLRNLTAPYSITRRL